MTTRLLVIGGSDAGICADLRARELDLGCEVTIMVADRFPNYSICGLPFYLSCEVPDWHALAHRTIDEITAAGVHLLLDCTVQAIDPASHCVSLVAARAGFTPPHRRGDHLGPQGLLSGCA